MRKIIILLSLTLVSWGVFAQNNQSDKTLSKEVQASIQIEKSTSVSAVINSYLALKDALVKEDSKKAASSGKELLSVLPKLDASRVASKQESEVTNIIKDASQHAKSIADNSGAIAQQRQHFEFLTKDVKDLIVVVGSDRALYQAYCPMYNNNTGGAWLSESKEISNPYFGSKMLKCGSVQQEITLK